VQPPVKSAGTSALTSAKSTNLGFKKLTAILLGKQGANKRRKCAKYSSAW
jgi:hypothetical protein